MPITPSHQWHESEAWVSIDVKIPNVTTTSLDIITTECYVKVNCAPYFFEADLYREVDRKLSKASVGFGAIKFFLVKKEHGLWERLSIPGDRNMKLQRRHQSLEAIREEREKMRKDYGAKFSNIGRLAVGDQIRMEEVKRKIIERRKEEENLKEQENIESWKEDITNKSQINVEEIRKNTPCIESKVSGTSTPCDKNVISKDSYTREPLTQCQETASSSILGKNTSKDLGKNLQNLNNITNKNKEKNQNPDEVRPTLNDSKVDEHNSFPNEDLQRISPPFSSSCNSKGRHGVDLRYTGMTLPAPRNCSNVLVTFSPKPDLPKHLPARESRDREIKLKKSGKASEDTLDVSERAPLFLQDKGDKFFKAGDYQSAVNAYTDALMKDSSLVLSFANRGACKLHLKEYKACMQDCTNALCILTKGTPDCAQETTLAQNLLVQESILAQNSLIPTESCSPSSASCDVIQPDECLVANRPPIRFPIESLELLTCLSGQGCFSMSGLQVEGVGVEEWKLGMKKHMLLRRGISRYYIGDLSKAIDDFAKVFQIEPSNRDVERILKGLRLDLVSETKGNE